MNKLIKRSGLVALASMMTLSPFALATPTDDMNIGAEILAPLTLTTVEQMNFGGIIPNPGTDTVTLTPAGAISSAGTSTFPNADQQQGIFDLIGANNGVVNISHPTSVTLTRSGGSSTMTVNNFTYAATVGDLNSGVSGSPQVTLSATGNATVAMGASLAIGAAQTAGVYEGTMTLTAVYN